MRIILFVVVLFSFSIIKSQQLVPFRVSTYPQETGLTNDLPPHDSLSKSKWFISTYKGLSTSISFFNARPAALLVAPLGLQLNRRLKNNFYAFANVAIAPVFMSMSPSFINTGINKYYESNRFISHNLNIYPPVSLGVMYMNDAQTFSISGSISAERSSYPLLPYHPGNNAQNRVMHSTR